MNYFQEFEAALQKFEASMSRDKQMILGLQGQIERLRGEKAELEGTVKSLKDQAADVKADLAKRAAELKEAEKVFAGKCEAKERELAGNAKALAERQRDADFVVKDYEGKLKDLAAEKAAHEKRVQALRQAVG
jgi:chromosome segregation ATPase